MRQDEWIFEMHCVMVPSVVAMGVTHAMRIVLAMCVGVRYAMPPTIVVIFNGGDSNDDICGCKIYNVRNSDSPRCGKSKTTLMTGKGKEGDGISLNEQLQPL